MLLIKHLSLWAQHVSFSFYVQITVVDVIANMSQKMYPFSQKIPLGNLTVIVFYLSLFSIELGADVILQMEKRDKLTHFLAIVYSGKCSLLQIELP